MPNHKCLTYYLIFYQADINWHQPGHEYTLSNIKFGQSILDTVWVQKLRTFSEENQETQGKFTIEDELRHNVFMRVEVCA